MKTIGILTFWGVPNYGAWAQSYALNNIVREIAGDKYDIKHIDYLSQIHNDLYYKTNIRLKSSFNYTWEEIPKTEHLNDKEISSKYFDIVITGSDSIWEFTLPEMGNDIHLIGNDLNASKIIAYAASAGITSVEDELPNYIKEGLTKYQAISVRDDNTFRLVYELTNKNCIPDIVLDPVLLWDFKSDVNVKNTMYTSYIAVYGTKWSPEFIAYAKKFAEEKGCMLIAIGDTLSWCDVSMRMVELRGFEWIGMIKNADYVFTSTYHGLLFSISLEKQFKFDMVPYVKNRAISIMNSLEIPYFYEEGKNIEEIFENTVDYSIVNKNLEILRNKSKNWLKDALED